MRLHTWAVPVVIGAAVAACSAGKHEQLGADYGAESTATVPKGGQQSSIGPGEHHVALFDPSTTFFAYVLHGQAGQSISIYEDGQQGLDTVVYLYKVSTRTGAPYGRPIAKNDDTESAGWTSNEYSSSIEHFVLPQTRDYAIVATTYDAPTTGRATVWYDVDLPQYDTPPPFGADGDPAPTPIAFQGEDASVLPLGAEVQAYAKQADGTEMLVLARVAIAPGDAQAILADSGRLGTFAFDVMYYANSTPPGTTNGYHGPASVSAIAAGAAASTIAQASGADPHLAEAEGLLVSSMLGDGDFATGSVQVFKTHWDNGDDTNSEGVLAIDPATGETRAVTWVNPP